MPPGVDLDLGHITGARGGELELLDRAPVRVVSRCARDERRVEAIAALHPLRFTRPEVAEILGMAPSTMSGILTRIGLGRSACSIGDRRLRRFGRVVDDEHGEGTCLKDVMADAPEEE
jgi:hypothetical protein